MSCYFKYYNLVNQHGKLKKHLLPRFEVLLLIVSTCAYLLLALSSLRVGGISVDEHIEAWGLIDNLRHGARIISGEYSNYKNIVQDLEFYGIVNKLPGLLMWALKHPGEIARIFSNEDAFELLGDMGESGYYAYSHIASIGFYILTLPIVALISIKCKVRNFLAPVLLCLWWPSFVGHSLMNIKDIPFALFYCSYTLSLILRVGKKRSGQSPLMRAFSAACAACLISMKFPSLVPVFVSEIVLSLVTYKKPSIDRSIQHKHSDIRLLIDYLRFFARSIIPFLFLTLSLAYTLTPSSWNDPFSFMKDSFELHTNHNWGNCTWLDGSCLGKAVDPNGWSTFSYVLGWTGVQLPVLILFLLLLGGISLVVYLASSRLAHQDKFHKTSKNIPLLFVSLQAFLLPVMAVINNSTLYGTLRHFTFSIPPLAILCIFGGERFGDILPKSKKTVIALALTLSTILVIDNLLLNPYQYVYMNELSRTRIDLSKTELDYWGFSSGELMRKVSRSEPDNFGFIIGHVPMFVTYYDVLGRTLVPDGPRFNAHFMVHNLLKDSSACREMAVVRRRLLASDEFILSKAYLCNE